MELETEASGCRNLTLQPSTMHFRWIGEQITILAEAFGEQMTPQRLKIYAGDLADIECAELTKAFQRARRECKFFPRIAEIRELAGANEQHSRDAESHAAWDVLMRFIDRHVWANPHGEYQADHVERLDQRIRDSVRRSGGWRAYKCVVKQDYPFLQKRFYEEYNAWSEVQRIDLGKMFLPLPRLELKAATNSNSAPTHNLPKPEPVKPFKAKPMPQTMTDAELRDRREMLHQQMEALKNRA